MSATLAHPVIRRGSARVLAPVRLELPWPAQVGVIGVNGAGKSTLMSALAGGLRPACGRVTLSLPVPLDRAAYAPQQPTFPSWLNVEQVAALYGTDWTTLCAAAPGLLLEELAGRRAQALSVGQRQALAVAIALAAHTPLLMLDEPFAALDFRRRVALLDLLRQRRARNDRALLLLSSQNGADLVETCDWMLVLRDGQYVFSGPTADLTGATADLTGATADPAAALQSLERKVLALLGIPDNHGVRSALASP